MLLYGILYHLVDCYCIHDQPPCSRIMGNPGNVSTVILRLFRLLNEFQHSQHLSASFHADVHYTPTDKKGQLENKK